MRSSGSVSGCSEWYTDSESIAEAVRSLSMKLRTSRGSAESLLRILPWSKSASYKIKNANKTGLKGNTIKSYQAQTEGHSLVCQRIVHLNFEGNEKEI